MIGRLLCFLGLHNWAESPELHIKKYTTIELCTRIDCMAFRHVRRRHARKGGK